MRHLVDSFGRVHNYLRISLTERCNFRCQYCMPAEGVPLQPESRILTRDEIVTLAAQFVDSGVDKIRLTGGEPTVRRDFMSITEAIGGLPGVKQLAITTNGLTLARKLPQLKSYGLTGVNISLDSLVEAKFNFFTRRQGLSRVLDAVHKSADIGIPNVKVNCVVMRGQNDDEIVDFVRLTRDLPIQIRFIEYMPFSGNKWNQRKMLSYLEMMDIIERAGYDLTRREHIAGETSKNYSVAGPDGVVHAGSVGFITSMTSNFCGTCNRLRITADGNLKVCLFGNEEVSLRDMLRSGASKEEIQHIIDIALMNKKKEHAGMNELKDMDNRPMILIGGSMKLNETAWSSCAARPATLLRRVGHSPYVSLQRRPSSGAHQLRMYATNRLTHIDSDGEAYMVDVAGKKHTKRRATAVGRIVFSESITGQQIRDNNNKKGDVLGVARVAGIMAAKQTSNLIPLCHPVATTKIKNKLQLRKSWVDVQCTVECVGPTGVEMEALVGATITLSTVYDMCKAVDKHMRIEGVQVVEKQGGAHDFNILP